MIHHVSVGSNELRASRAFYDPLMAHLGLRLLDVTDGAADYGVGDILFSVETPADGTPATVGNGSHVAFAAHDREMVDRFYQLALANGGTDAGMPGLRPAYDANYNLRDEIELAFWRLKKPRATLDEETGRVLRCSNFTQDLASGDTSMYRTCPLSGGD